MTGRHYFRVGVLDANVGRLRSGEITIAERLRSIGHATGIFGKWHLGTPSALYHYPQGTFDPNRMEAFPHWFGFNRSFVTHRNRASSRDVFGSIDGICLEVNGLPFESRLMDSTSKKFDYR